MRDQRVGQLLRAAARNHPSNDVRHRAEHQPEAGRQRPIERQHAVRGDAAEQARASRSSTNVLLASPSAERSASSPNPRKRERMSRPCEWAEHRTLDRGQLRDKTAEQRGTPARRGRAAPPCVRPIVRQPPRSRRRMDARAWRTARSIRGRTAQRQCSQERRGDRRRVDGRTDVVDEPGQRQLGRSRTAADRSLSPRRP